MAKGNGKKSSNGSALEFEAQLWAAADKMRGHMDASEYKHVCLGLIFLKYISDAFEEKREQLLFGFSDPKSEWFIKDEPQRAEAAENRDEYLAANVFWLPPEARWHKIKAKGSKAKCFRSKPPIPRRYSPWQNWRRKQKVSSAPHPRRRL